MYVVIWNDPNNSVQRKGAVEYRGQTTFSTESEAREAYQADRMEELDVNPNSEMTWTIMQLPEPKGKAQ
jgi:hypothetical protein